MGEIRACDEKSVPHHSPKIVKWFKDHNIKIKDIALGDLHSIALDSNGNTYTWGYGGKKGLFNWIYSQQVGALGHGDKETFMIPK